MRNFEQLNDFILLDNNIVFTLSGLRNWVYGNIEYPKDLDFQPNGIHKDYWGKYEDFCIDQWLDVEDNFQSACNKVYERTVSEGETFKSNNTYSQTQSIL